MFRLRRVFLIVLAGMLAACAPTGGSAPASTRQPPAGGPTAAGSLPSAATPAAGGAPPAATAPPAPVALRLGLNTPTANIAPVWVAKEAGFFAKYGIDAELTPIPGGERVVSALLSGEVPLTILAGTGLVAARLGGADLAFYGSLANRLRYWLYARPEIGTVADLRGRRVAVTSRGGIVRRAADLTLERNGLDPERDVTYVTTGQITESVTALLTGAVDAALLSPPGTFRAEDEGMRLLVNTQEYNFAAVISGIASTRGWVGAHEDLARRALQAIAEGIAYSHREKEPTKAIIARWTQTDDPVLLERTYVTVAPGWERSLRVPPEAIRNELDGIAADLPAARDAAPEQFYDNRLIDALERDGFFQQLGW
ncbi:MAG TPA: ABC transporter substrate-binding protein [Chloroflexota bacterium]|nr:ABC transporter substrate-binding protein [Chloroflexota bacterium]